MRFFSTELVTLSNETRAEKAQGLRDRIHWAVSNATLNYYAAVYGVESEGTQQALTASVELDTLLFGQGFCLSPVRAAEADECPAGYLLAQNHRSDSRHLRYGSRPHPLSFPACTQGGTQCYGEREPWYSSTAYGLDDIFHSWAEEVREGLALRCVGA